MVSYKRNAGLLLKMIDMFRIPVEMFLHRRDRDTNEKDDYYRLGTMFGGIMTLLIWSLLSLYMVSLLITMHSQNYDILNLLPTPNKFTDGYDRISIQKQNFLPSIKFRSAEDDEAEFNKYILNKEGGVDITKISEYVSFVINIEV